MGTVFELGEKEMKKLIDSNFMNEIMKDMCDCLNKHNLGDYDRLIVLEWMYTETKRIVEQRQINAVRIAIECVNDKKNKTKMSYVG